MRCAAINCNSSTVVNQSEDKLFFFRFPSDVDLCKLWVLCCRRFEFFKEEPSILHLKYKICSRHFVSDMVFMKNGNAYLMNNAVPTNFDFPVVYFDEPSSPRIDEEDEHGYSRPKFGLPGSQVSYDLLTRVVEISQGKYFICGGALLNPGTLKNTLNANQVGVLLGIVKENKVSKIICENVCCCYTRKTVLLSRSARYWLKRLNNKFPPGQCEVTTPVSNEEFFKGIVIDKSLNEINSMNPEAEISETEDILMPRIVSVSGGPKKSTLTMEPPPLSTPQSVLLLTKKKTKKTLVPIHKPPSICSPKSGTDSPLDSLLALQCDPQSVEPVRTDKSVSLPVDDDLNVDSEHQKCSEWIEKHIGYFKSKNVENVEESTSPGKECNKLIVQLSNAPISDTLKRDLVTLLAENKDKNELEAIVNGKSIKATKQLIKVPVQCVNGSLGDIKKQIEGALRSQRPDGEDPSVSQVSLHNFDALSDERASKRSADILTVPDGPPKKFRKLSESNSKIPPHIRDIILRNSNPMHSKKIVLEPPLTKPGTSPLKPLQPTPCVTCTERSKKPTAPAPQKILIRQLKDFPEYLLLKKQLSAAKRRIHKLEKTNSTLREKARNPPKIKVERILEEIQKYLSMDAFTLVQSTVMHNAKDVGPHGHRFSDQLKNLGYRLMLSGVQVYKCFAHIFNLPCTTTMKKWISQYEKKHIDSLFGLNTNKGESLSLFVPDEEEEEGEKDDSQEQEEVLKSEEHEQKPYDHSYTGKPTDEAAETPDSQEETLASSTFLAHPAVEGVILEEGDETYEIHENGEVAALEVILDDGEDGPLQIPIEQLYALQQHYVIET